VSSLAACLNAFASEAEMGLPLQKFWLRLAICPAVGQVYECLIMKRPAESK
jgi:hypothetical protein